MILRSMGARLGFYLAMIGTASGLGNLWRFPYIVDENGGGAFVLLYILMVFLVGMPLLISELLLGKSGRKSILEGIKNLVSHPAEAETKPPNWLKKVSPGVGVLSLLAGVLVLGYFSVISGWVLFYLFHLIIGLFSPMGFDPSMTLSALINNGWMQLIFCGIHLSAVILVVSIDFDEGIETFVGYMMPLFGVLLCLLTWKSISLETSEQALRFLFYPDFSALSLSSPGHALGHVLFTLSIGIATMVTFGRHLPETSKVPHAGFRIATVDSIISILAGMLVFPLVISFSSVEHGPLLLFETVPMFLNSLPGGNLFSLWFFICLYMGSFAASLSLLDTLVVNLKEKSKVARTKAAVSGGFLAFTMAILPALSSSTFGDLRVRDNTLLEVWDNTLVNWILPVAAVLVSQVIYYYLPKQAKLSEFKDEENPKYNHIYGQWRMALRYLVPFVAIVCLMLQLVDLIF